MSNDSGSHKLTIHILIALVAGLLAGIIVFKLGKAEVLSPDMVKILSYDLFGAGGDIFKRMMKMLLVPLVFVSLVCGVTALTDVSKLGALGGKTLALYLMTTALAITFAIVLGIIVSPGEGFNIPTSLTYEPPEPKSIRDVFVSIIPANPVKAMAEGNMLPLIVFSIFFGLAINYAGAKGAAVKQFFDQLNEVVLELVNLVMKFAPIGVFCLTFAVFAKIEPDKIGKLGLYFGTVVAALLIHATVTYSTLLTLFTRLNPLIFLKKMRSTMMFAFSTASSAATIPITLKTCEEKLGAHNSVSSFTVPLGATVNMDGTAIMQGVATVFIAQAYGIDLGVGDYLTVIFMATLASIGTAGVPGAGLVMLTMVLTQINLPTEAIGILLAVDRLLDMVRTAVNVTGDATVTCIVANSEKQLDKNIFQSDDKGQLSKAA